MGMPCVSTAQTPCTEVPVGFRQDIRLPDVWESAWESVWPNALEAMAFWRAENFIEVQQLWLRASPCADVWRAAQTAHNLPPSAQWLHVGVRHARVWRRSAAVAVLQVPDDFWPTHSRQARLGAMTLALTFGPPDLSARRARSNGRAAAGEFGLAGGPCRPARRDRVQHLQTPRRQSNMPGALEWRVGQPSDRHASANSIPMKSWVWGLMWGSFLAVWVALDTRMPAPPGCLFSHQKAA